MLAFDLTPTISTAYEEKRGREETAVVSSQRERPKFDETLFIGFQGEVPLLKRQTDPTPTAEELRTGQGGNPRGQSDDEVLEARDTRLALLARKYEGVASVEDGARLRILTERLRKLAPRVTHHDLEQVVEMVADAEGIAARLAAVKDKFGLR